MIHDRGLSSEQLPRRQGSLISLRNGVRRALPQVPALDDPHPHAFIQCRRTGRVLGINGQHRAADPASGERPERAAEEGAGDPAPTVRRQDADLADPAGSPETFAVSAPTAARPSRAMSQSVGS